MQQILESVHFADIYLYGHIKIYQVFICYVSDDKFFFGIPKDQVIVEPPYDDLPYYDLSQTLKLNLSDDELKDIVINLINNRLPNYREFISDLQCQLRWTKHFSKLHCLYEPVNLRNVRGLIR